MQKKISTKAHEKFNRKTFSPDTNDTHLDILYRLRNKGWTRRIAYRQAKDNEFKDCPPNKYARLQSTAMWHLRLLTEPWDSWNGKENKIDYKGKVFADFGCGQSPDGLIALDLGFKKAVLFDLCRVRGNWETGIEFHQEDICEKLDVKENSIDHAICQAVIDLIEPEARIKFYKNAYKLLKPGGYFAVYIASLKNGYGFNILREIENCMDVGFSLERQFIDGFVMQK